MLDIKEMGVDFVNHITLIGKLETLALRLILVNIKQQQQMGVDFGKVVLLYSTFSYLFDKTV